MSADPLALNAAPCPNCGAPVVPACDAECPVCLLSFADEHTWDHLR